MVVPLADARCSPEDERVAFEPSLGGALSWRSVSPDGGELR
jgi:hypothetical protein